LNSRFTYGTLLSTGGPNSVRVSRWRVPQSITAVPPSGRVSVFSTLIVWNCGCWMNCVNGIGCPDEPPSNTGVTNVVTGNSGTWQEASSFHSAFRPTATYRRSADTVGQALSVNPVVNASFFGTAACPPPTLTTVTPVT
jgi:hypothetical protein